MDWERIKILREIFRDPQWGSTHVKGFPQIWAGFWEVQRVTADRAPHARSTPRDSQELCSMHRTHREKVLT